MDITKRFRIKLEADNRVLEIGTGGRYGLVRIEGLDSPLFDLGVQENTFQDGSRINKRKITGRQIIIEGEYKKLDFVDERKNLVSFFNVHNKGKLTISFGNIKRTIGYDVENVKIPIKNLYEPMRFLVQLYCVEPFLLDDFIRSEEIVTWIGGLEFPVRLPTTFATEGESVLNLYNSGDWETPFTIEIMGPSTNPLIANHSTGDFIKVNKKIEEGETLVITTAVGNKRAELNGNFASNLIHYTSKYFNLKKGDNVIEVESEDLQDNAKIKISYFNRYLGV